MTDGLALCGGTAMNSGAESQGWEVVPLLPEAGLGGQQGRKMLNMYQLLLRMGSLANELDCFIL